MTSETEQAQRLQMWRVAKIVGIVVCLVGFASVALRVIVFAPSKNEFGLWGAVAILVDPGIEVYIGKPRIGNGPHRIDDLAVSERQFDDSTRVEELRHSYICHET